MVHPGSPHGICAPDMTCFRQTSFMLLIYWSRPYLKKTPQKKQELESTHLTSNKDQASLGPSLLFARWSQYELFWS